MLIRETLKSSSEIFFEFLSYFTRMSVFACCVSVSCVHAIPMVTRSKREYRQLLSALWLLRIKLWFSTRATSALLSRTP